MRGSRPKATALNVVPRLPQVLPAKIAAAEFALVLAIMTGAVIVTALWVAVIHVRVQPFAGGVFKLLVSHGAKRHTTRLHLLIAFLRFFAPQDRVVLLAADLGPFKPYKHVVLWVFNYHTNNRVNGQGACIYMILFFYGTF